MGTRTLCYPLTALWINNPTFDTGHQHRHRSGMLTKTPPPSELQIPATVTTLPKHIVFICNFISNLQTLVGNDCKTATRISGYNTGTETKVNSYNTHNESCKLHRLTPACIACTNIQDSHRGRGTHWHVRQNGIQWKTPEVGQLSKHHR